MNSIYSANPPRQILVGNLDQASHLSLYTYACQDTKRLESFKLRMTKFRVSTSSYTICKYETSQAKRSKRWFISDVSSGVLREGIQLCWHHPARWHHPALLAPAP